MSKADRAVNAFIIVLVVAIGLLGAFIVGTYYPSVRDARLDGLHEVECDDIIRYPDGKFVCEVNMQAEDDNLKIYKGAGAYDDK